jgi:hypothetical protein
VLDVKEHPTDSHTNNYAGPYVGLILADVMRFTVELLLKFKCMKIFKIVEWVVTRTTSKVLISDIGIYSRKVYLILGIIYSKQTHPKSRKSKYVVVDISH